MAGVAKNPPNHHVFQGVPCHSCLCWVGRVVAHSQPQHAEIGMAKCPASHKKGALCKHKRRPQGGHEVWVAQKVMYKYGEKGRVRGQRVGWAGMQEVGWKELAMPQTEWWADRGGKAGSKAGIYKQTNQGTNSPTHTTANTGMRRREKRWESPEMRGGKGEGAKGGARCRGRWGGGCSAQGMVAGAWGQVGVCHACHAMGCPVPTPRVVQLGNAGHTRERVWNQQ